MADTILTLRQLEAYFQSLTAQMLGLDPASNPDKVRISWPSDGSPAWKRTDDVVFLRVNNIDDNIQNQRDTTYGSLDDVNLNQSSSYIRVHEISYTLYGPNSYDNAEKIKNAFYSASEVLGQQNMALILNISPPNRIPELFNGQWWERSDFSIRVNEKIEIQNPIPYLTGLNIQTMEGEIF